MTPDFALGFLTCAVATRAGYWVVCAVLDGLHEYRRITAGWVLFRPERLPRE